MNQTISQSMLYGVIGILAVIIGVIGYRLYEERHTSSVEISIGGKGLVIEGK
jgi:hypothetical protein